ncbi:MAG TPA: hypothetical protein DIW36_03830, partial [Ruminococcaceae bacterium]|nr:hypothetical protein [Oscillospiraceae bacterium]
MIKKASALLLAVLFIYLPAVPITVSAKTAVPSAEEIVKMSKYDGRDYGIITPVKDQGESNLCWAYSSIAASETSILRQNIGGADAGSLSLNPVAAAYRSFRRESDPLSNTDGDWKSGDYTKATGNPLNVAKLFSMWWGPVAGNQANIDPFANPSYRFENAFYIPENKSNPDEGIKAIKKAIAEYGAVTFQYNNLRECTYYNPKSEPGSGSSPHACTIIGWDDNIPASKFIPGAAERDGGWLVKNSYKSCEYFWLSYDNTSSSMYAFTYAEKDKYDYNYFYDGSLDDFSLRNDKVIANVFQAQKGGTNGKSELIKAVNVGVQGENVTVEVEIMKNLDYPFNGQSNVPVSGGQSAGTTAKTFEHGGYVTVELKDPVKVDPNEWFSVIVRVSNSAGNAKIVTAYRAGKDLSYVGSGENWNKLGNFVGRIKAYTSLAGCENPSDHKWRDWALTEKPTASSDGKKARTCSLCGQTETAVIEHFAKNCIADGQLVYGFEQKLTSEKF